MGRQGGQEDGRKFLIWCASLADASGRKEGYLLAGPRYFEGGRTASLLSRADKGRLSQRAVALKALSEGQGRGGTEQDRTWAVGLC